MTIKITATISEKQFRQQIIDLLRLFGWKYYFTWTSLHSPSGFPDIIALRDGMLIIAELKSEKGRVTPAQKRWLEAFGGLANCWAFVWKPSMWDSIVAVLGGEHAGNLAQGKDEA